MNRCQGFACVLGSATFQNIQSPHLRARLISFVRGSSLSAGYHKRRSGDQRRLTRSHTPCLFRLSAALETINSPRPDPRKFRLACIAAGIWDQLQTNIAPFIEELARMPAEDRLRRALATLLNGGRSIDPGSMSGFLASHAPCGLKAEKFQSGDLQTSLGS